MGEIIIKGYKILFDDTDEDAICPYNWAVRLGWGDTPYAQTSVNGKSVLMHRLLLDAPKGMLVDHRNHNTLDNRRENIRLCTRSQNMWNRKRTTGKSKHKGVYWCVNRHKWRVQIYFNNQHSYLGLYVSEEDAARAYNNKAKELFGDFACLNIVGE